MRRLAFLIFLFLFAAASPAGAHIGSPDVFFSGSAGPYPVEIAIHMPSVVPGRAQITIQTQGDQPLHVSILPLYSTTAIANAPPPEPALPVRGQPNLYSGELWLMSFGAYNIEVRIEGSAGVGTVRVPVNSVALHQLPLPGYLKAVLLMLGGLLVFGGLGILAAAARESVLEPGAQPAGADRRRGWVTGGVGALVVVLALAEGMVWWRVSEADFRRHLRAGAWPDLAAEIRMEQGERVLTLTLGERTFAPSYALPLMLDHGKLLHLFLLREGTRDAFAHLHPVRTGAKTFDVALPPLPDGRYRIFCDLTLGDSGISSTASTEVTLPSIAPAALETGALSADPDDSWASYPAAAVPSATPGAATVYHLPDGGEVIWEAHPALRPGQDAAFRFDVLDASGHPAKLEPYMGMTSHAAVSSEDGAVFAHLHPMGNFSMGAEAFFQAKMTRETGAPPPAGAMAGCGMADMASPSGTSANTSLIAIPYQFPAPGSYRLWIQFKTGGKVGTAVFDTVVGNARPGATLSNL